MTYDGGGVPPGWYDDATGSGAVRWWDGQRWTEHRAPGSPGPTSPYQGAAPTSGTGHPPLAWGAYQAASPPARRGRSRRILWVALVVVVLTGGFVLFESFSGGGTKSEWYQQGYDEGRTTALTFVKTGSTPEGACDLALAGKIKFDDSSFSRRVKDLRKGCLQGVKDFDDGHRLPTLP